MDWMQFVAAMTSSLAWPLAVVGIVLALRGPISRLLPKIRRFTYGDLEIDLEEQLKSVEQKVAAESGQAETILPPVLPSAKSELALRAPRAAILSSWVEVETAIDRLMKRAGVFFYNENLEPRIKMRSLKDRGVVDDFTYEAFVQLFKIRSDALHMREVDLDYDEAVSMSALCNWLIARLDGLPKQNAQAPT
ncbi:hypothetical protein [Pseudomonas juntendi]|uniref:hypothetical protein n=1 Tax=Pseudomonas juntendi TaxID=2666183 RepID=UPI001B836197|nr:hypothetical protein [Pseudomonas juntendi]MBR7520396.1 hypothetical protein [Pseudomonas juntendi]